MTIAVLVLTLGGLGVAWWLIHRRVTRTESQYVQLTAPI